MKVCGVRVCWCSQRSHLSRTSGKPTATKIIESLQQGPLHIISSPRLLQSNCARDTASLLLNNLSKMATSNEDIQKQHEEARVLVEQPLAYSEPKSSAEIPLTSKTCRICELDAETVQKIQPYWTSRGDVDVSKLQSLVQEGFNWKYEVPKKKAPKQSPTKTTNNKNQKSASSKTPQKSSTNAANPIDSRPIFTQQDIKSTTNLWDPINAAVNNVSICRPSHDAWGIHKIVLLFCDDFVQRLYSLPWWHERSDMREAIQPILDALQVDPACVVRLLMASLPPGVTIPVHEDSGAWVSRTHRVHVPILVEHADQILFRCGPSVESMERIHTRPGHVFEMNNQAKHAVSNCSNDYRVHLILDYVDRDYQSSLPPRINLEPGEILVQTRRSIDRIKDHGSRPTPSFMILGAQKAGTTSLYEYIVQHPLVVRAKRRESHCLDWRWNPDMKTTTGQRKWCHQFYLKEELDRHPSCLTGDSTPSYLIDSRRVIPRLKKVFDWPLKFFVMLRNPVKRAESHYAMVTSTKGTPEQMKARGSEWRSKSFREVAMEDLEQMKECGLIPYWSIKEGSLNQEVFASFSGTAQEDKAWDAYMKLIPLNSGSYSLLGRGLYELNLRPWFKEFSKSQFLVLQLEKLKSEGVSAMMDKVWNHLEIPSYQVEDESAKNTREYESAMDKGLQDYLERFFEPHNRKLEESLGDEWVGAWASQNQENLPHQG